MLVLTGVPYEDLDLPKLDDLSTGARSEHVQHTLYKRHDTTLAALAGLTVLVRRNSKNDHHDGGDDHES
ncbi:hydrogenase-2 small subunit [Salmonella enterica subsp. enterica serovar Typhimurium]|nr:hydrogenase-2 small subunit [Salmonella enterica subsp. enterica serovar Typhimurium]